MNKDLAKYLEIAAQRVDPGEAINLGDKWVGLSDLLESAAEEITRQRAEIDAMPKPDLELTAEMINAIHRVADRKGNLPMSVLKRAISTYVAKFDPQEPPDQRLTNVVQFHRDES